VDWQSVKEFLKPDPHKIIGTFFIFFLIFVFSLFERVQTFDPISELISKIRGFLILPMNLVPFLSVLLIGGESFAPLSPLGFTIIILLLLYWYLISSIIVWIFQKMRKSIFSAIFSVLSNKSQQE
jgi:hypothetical protein